MADQDHDKMNVSKSGGQYKATVTRHFNDEETAHNWAESNMSTTGENPVPNPQNLEESLQVPQVMGGELHPVSSTPVKDDAEAAGIDVSGTPGDPNPNGDGDQGDAPQTQESDTKPNDTKTRNNPSDKPSA